MPPLMPRRLAMMGQMKEPTNCIRVDSAIYVAIMVLSLIHIFQRLDITALLQYLLQRFDEGDLIHLLGDAVQHGGKGHQGLGLSLIHI